MQDPLKYVDFQPTKYKMIPYSNYTSLCLQILKKSQEEKESLDTFPKMLDLSLRSSA